MDSETRDSLNPAQSPLAMQLRERARRWRRWVALAGVLLLAAWFARFAYLRITLRPALRPEYWEAQLAALDPPPPGALSFEAVRSLLTSRAWEKRYNPPVPVSSAARIIRADPERLLEGPWSMERAEVLSAIEVFMTAEFRTERQQLLEALQTGWEEPISMQPGSYQKHLNDYQAWAEWLAIHGRWALATADTQSATEDWLGLLRFARQALHGRTPAHVGWSRRVMSMAAIELMLAVRESTEPLDSRRIEQTIYTLFPNEVAPGQLLAGQRLAALCDLESIYVREGDGWLDLCDTIKVRGGFNLGVPPPSRWWNLASPLFHDFTTATRELERCYQRMEACTDLTAWHSMYAVSGRYQYERHDILHGILPGAYARPGPDTLEMAYRSWTRLNAAAAMHALAAWRQERGKYPESLTELVPEYLPALPIDYGDRQPLRYRRLREHYLLYSIGNDGQDDGGIGPSWFTRSVGLGSDIVFTAVRRQDLEDAAAGMPMRR